MSYWGREKPHSCGAHLDCSKENQLYFCKGSLMTEQSLAL